jgi:hypothetical protein
MSTNFHFHCYRRSSALQLLMRQQGKLILNPTSAGAITQLYAGTAPENASKSGKVSPYDQMHD